MNILNKIKSIVRNAILKTIFDDGVHQTGEFSFMGVKQNGVVYSPYGLYSNPKKGSFSVLLQAGGKEDSLVGLVWNPKDRPKLEEGAVAMQSDGGKMSVICHPDGKIELKGASQEVLAVVSDFMAKTISNIELIINDQHINAVVGAPVKHSPDLVTNWALPVTGLKALMEETKANLDTMKK